MKNNIVNEIRDILEFKIIPYCNIYRYNNYIHHIFIKLIIYLKKKGIYGEVDIDMYNQTLKICHNNMRYILKYDYDRNTFSIIHEWIDKKEIKRFNDNIRVIVGDFIGKEMDFYRLDRMCTDILNLDNEFDNLEMSLNCKNMRIHVRFDDEEFDLCFNIESGSNILEEVIVK